jgi:hypothetical protein
VLDKVTVTVLNSSERPLLTRYPAMILHRS